MIVNADGQILGRLSAFVAKQALLGEKVIVINAEKAIVSGREKSVLKTYSARLERKSKGNYVRGPKHQKRPDRFVRRNIRCMLPWSKPKGKEAFKRVMVYIGAPEDEIKSRHDIDLKKEKPQDLRKMKKEPERYVTVEKICEFIGGKW